MNNLDKAQWLSDCWADVAQGGHWECKQDGGWATSAKGGATGVSNPDLWRVVMPPKLKVIDLTPLIESGLDCEFWDDDDDKDESKRDFGILQPSSNRAFERYDDQGGCFENCQPRMSPHVHYWGGGYKCPVPEGFEMRLHLREGESWISGATRWIHTGQGGDIIGIEVISVADGYTLGGGE